MKLKIAILLSCIFITGYQTNVVLLPQEFVYVNEIIPEIDVELRYYSTNNFVGDTIDSYKSNRLILTKLAALALKNVQDELQNKNLCLRIYDGYRPQAAVDHFIQWARNLNDTIQKAEFYPNVKKRNLFRDGYIASKSGHSRGSTLDLTLVDASTDKPLDMGSPYDYFGIESWIEYNNLTAQQKSNRLLLQNVMSKNGFRNYPKEWWHFTLRNEPFPETYFNFPVE